MLPLRHLSILLAALLCSCSTARVLERESWDFFTNSPAARNSSLEKRQSNSQSTLPCFKVCGALSTGGCSGTICSDKRSLPEDLVEYNSSIIQLSKRLLPEVNVENPGELTTYLDSQSARVFTPRKLCPGNSKTKVYPWGCSYCVQQEFSTANLNANGQWLAGSANTVLEGCTVLTIASARGVYMCHFWEDVHYLKVAADVSRPVQGFQPILDLIQSGTNQPETFTLGAGLNPALFNQPEDRPLAAIMTPLNHFSADNPSSPQASKSPEYQAEYDQLVALLKRLIPNVEVYQYSYLTPEEGQDYANGYQGIALFEYDNNADGGGTPNWRLWYENQFDTGWGMGQAVS